MKRTIAGHEIELTSGQNYLASRPMGKCNPVSIKNDAGVTCAQITGLTYDEANELLNAFNNGAVSFDGRVW